VAGAATRRLRQKAGLPKPEPKRGDQWQEANGKASLAMMIARPSAPAGARPRDPYDDPRGVQRAILCRFAEEAIDSEELTPVAVAAGKVVLDEIARILPRTASIERPRTATETLEAIRAALPELEAKARAENAAAGTVTSDVATDEQSW
jgi:hypothetical protein